MKASIDMTKCGTALVSSGEMVKPDRLPQALTLLSILSLSRNITIYLPILLLDNLVPCIRDHIHI